MSDHHFSPQEIKALREEREAAIEDWPNWHLSSGPDGSPLYWAEIKEEERARRAGLH